MPSRFEPCGLNQMYSLRYGTPPIVRETGGLADTVVDCNEATLAGNGQRFRLPRSQPRGLLETIRRAVAAWHDKALWHKLQRNGMVLDFGWSKAANAYSPLRRTWQASRKGRRGGARRPRR
jgi:starch synthase